MRTHLARMLIATMVTLGKLVTWRTRAVESQDYRRSCTKMMSLHCWAESLLADSQALLLVAMAAKGMGIPIVAFPGTIATGTIATGTGCCCCQKALPCCREQLRVHRRTIDCWPQLSWQMLLQQRGLAGPMERVIGFVTRSPHSLPCSPPAFDGLAVEVAALIQWQSYRWVLLVGLLQNNNHNEKDGQGRSNPSDLTQPNEQHTLRGRTVRILGCFLWSVKAARRRKLVVFRLFRCIAVLNV